MNKGLYLFCWSCSWKRGHESTKRRRVHVLNILAKTKLTILLSFNTTSSGGAREGVIHCRFSPTPPTPSPTTPHPTQLYPVLINKKCTDLTFGLTGFYACSTQHSNWFNYHKGSRASMNTEKAPIPPPPLTLLKKNTKTPCECTCACKSNVSLWRNSLIVNNFATWDNQVTLNTNPSFASFAPIPASSARSLASPQSVEAKCYLSFTGLC